MIADSYFKTYKHGAVHLVAKYRSYRWVLWFKRMSKVKVGSFSATTYTYNNNFYLKIHNRMTDQTQTQTTIVNVYHTISLYHCYINYTLLPTDNVTLISHSSVKVISMS